MSRASTNEAQQAATNANNMETASLGKANALYDQLTPTYEQEITNPQGYGAPDLASMNTEAQQSAGGAVGAAVGQAGRMAAANRNSGSFAPTLDESSRDAGRTLSSNALDIQGKNANLKQSQRQAGVSGLQGLEGQQNSDVLGSIGLQNTAADSLSKAAGSKGWLQTLQSMGFLNGGASGGAASMAMDS